MGIRVFGACLTLSGVKSQEMLLGGVNVRVASELWAACWLFRDLGPYRACVASGRQTWPSCPLWGLPIPPGWAVSGMNCHGTVVDAAAIVGQPIVLKCGDVGYGHWNEP